MKMIMNPAAGAITIMSVNLKLNPSMNLKARAKVNPNPMMSSGWQSIARGLMLAWLSLVLASCGAPNYSASVTEEESEFSPSSSSARDGKYYLDDGPPEINEERLAAIPDAVPRVEKIIAATTRPYTALGNKYWPRSHIAPYSERGIASWYGKRYHGRPTASGEPYDMFAMSAAHPTLPIPSYVRVTRVDDNRSVIVRINDRGPFLRGRVIDLSFAAAYRLGIVQQGSGEVVVEAIVPDGTPAGGSHQQGAQNTQPDFQAVEQGPQGVYIQLGAFAERANAERQLRDVQTAVAQPLNRTIYERDGLHLLLIGPYASESEARAHDNILCAANWCGFLTRAPLSLP